MVPNVVADREDPRPTQRLDNKSDVAGSCKFSEVTPSRFDWLVVPFLLVVQQGAFVSIPMVVSDVSLGDMRQQANPLNTLAIAISLLVVVVRCVARRRQLLQAIGRNRLSWTFVCLVGLSTLWSIHPEITLRRATGYLLSVLIAASLTERFTVVGTMRLFSASFAVSAIGSLVFVAVSPVHGIMHQDGLAGMWQGVFPHKEVLGTVMATAVFVEIYLLMMGRWRPRWRLALLATYASLVVLSESRAALFLSAAYVTGAALYLMWQRDRVIGLMVSMTAAVAVVSGAILFASQPDYAFSIIGKDSTLTGRTELWPAVLELMTERPLLGWGYRAMWQPDDAVTAIVDDRVGWSVPSSHNGFLEVGLQLGAAGVLLIVSIIVQALRRGYQCCVDRGELMGWFLIVFAIGLIITGQILDSIGQNQVIEWVLFNTLSFACGLSLVSHGRRGADAVVMDRYPAAHIAPHRRQGLGVHERVATHIWGRGR